MPVVRKYVRRHWRKHRQAKRCYQKADHISDRAKINHVVWVALPVQTVKHINVKALYINDAELAYEFDLTYVEK